MTGTPHSDRTEAALSCDSGSGSDGIMRHRLTVTALRDGYVYLEGERDTACSSCAAKTGCGAGALSEMIGGKQTLRLPQTIPMAVGDDVVVAMEPRAFLGAALRAYLLPPLALVVTAGLAVGLGLGDAATAGLCLPALALSFVPLVRAERRSQTYDALWIEELASP